MAQSTVVCLYNVEKDITAYGKHEVDLVGCEKAVSLHRTYNMKEEYKIPRAQLAYSTHYLVG